MKKRLLLLTLGAFVGFTANSQTLIKTTRGFKNEELKIKTSSVEKDLTGSVVCNTAFVAGTTMDLNFTYTPSTTTDEYGAILELTFPTGITPNSGTTPLMATDFGQPTADLTISGQTCTWTSGDLTFGGIVVNGSPIDFVVNVTIDALVSGVQDVTYEVTGDGFNEPAPTVVSGTLTVADNNVPFTDVKVIATAVNARFDAGDGNFYNTANCNITQLPVACNIVNLGNTPANNFEVSYQLNNGTAVSETITTEIPAGDTSWYYFTATIDNLTQDAHEIRSYVSVTSDVDNANDTSSAVYFVNSLPTDLSSSNYSNSMSSIYDLYSMYRTWMGPGSPFNISSSYFNSSPYALFFSPSVVSDYPEGTYTTYAYTPCLDVEAGSQYVIKYYRKSNEAAAGSVYTVNGETAILVGEDNDPTKLDTLRDFTAIIPNDASTGNWELDTVIYTADVTGTKYFAIAGRGETAGTAQAPTKVGNVRIDDIEVYLLSPSVLGITENSINEFVVYPNPARGLVNVSLNNVNGNISLLSADGKVIESREVSSNTETFNVESLNAGIYFIQVGSSVQKLMVK